VLRFGGLIGEDRNPYIFWLVVKPDKPNAPVNLIHQEDCIGIILKIIQTNTWEKPNASTPFHPPDQYIIPKAIELNLIPPTFNHGNKSVGKTILSDKLEKCLITLLQKQVYKVKTKIGMHFRLR
jgi:hypothetical protein